MKTYNVKQISEILNVNPETVRRWIREGKLKAEKASNKQGNSVSEVELDRYIKMNSQYTAAGSVGSMLMNNKTPAATIGFLTGSILASVLVAALLRSRSSMEFDDEQVPEEDLMSFLRDELEKRVNGLEEEIRQKKELIEKTREEIEAASKRITQYSYLLGHEEVLNKAIENLNIDLEEIEF